MKQQPQGFILIIAVLVISSLLSVVLISMSLGALTKLETTTVALTGMHTKLHTEGCAEEALIQINRDPDYAGGTVNFNGGTCTINISGSYSKILDISGTLNTYTHTLQIVVTLDPLQIVTWDN